MRDLLKRIFLSKVFRLIASVVLVYFAFQRVNIVEIVGQIATVSWWKTFLILLYFLMGNILWSWRWSLLALDRPKFSDVLAFTWATYMGSFYSIFLASSVGGDLVKWVPHLKKYPKLSKTRLLSSVLVDRIIGISAFSAMACVVVIIAKLMRYQFPDSLFWFFIILFWGFCLFYILVFYVRLDGLSKRGGILKKFLEMAETLRSQNRQRVFRVFLISFLGEPIWVMAFWFYSLIFNAGIGLIPIFIFVPLINLIIALPISIGGFGPRESLFVYFFSQAGISDEKILLVSAYSGIIGVLNAALGGIVVFFSNFKREEKK